MQTVLTQEGIKYAHLAQAQWRMFPQWILGVPKTLDSKNRLARCHKGADCCRISRWARQCFLHPIPKPQGISESNHMVCDEEKSVGDSSENGDDSSEELDVSMPMGEASQHDIDESVF